MTPEPPPAPLDLLVVGALTVDHFADGSSAPGGTVLHAARAAAVDGQSVGAVTMAGPEPMADAGLDELQQLCAALIVQPVAGSVAFEHAEHGDARELMLRNSPGASLLVPAELAGGHAVLWGPVAGELSPAALSAGSFARRGAILQGWLRDLRISRPVAPLALAAVPAELGAALGDLDMVLVSHDDLAAEASDPVEQLAVVRRLVGTPPAIVLTAGSEGIWLSRRNEAQHLPAPAVVTGRSTVGAGDMLAALMLTWWADDLEEIARRAMRQVADILAARPPTH